MSAYLKAIELFISRQKYLLGLLLFAGFLFFLRLGAFYLFDLDEAVFAEATREMLETGDWITPHYNYVPRYDKPILFYWMMASAYQIFGVNEFAARFWSAMMGIALLLITYLFTRSIWGQRIALAVSFVLASSIEIIVLSHTAITDMTLTFFITMALFSFFKAYSADNALARKRWYQACFLGMALAVLTKGLVGIVLPALIVLAFLFLAGRLKDLLKEPGLVQGTFLFLAVALPWYLLEFAINGREFFEAFFLKHHFTRYTGVVSGHRGPFYYFLIVILIGFFPWSAFLPAALIKTLPRQLNKLRSAPPSTHINLFVLIWFSVIFIFFSFSQTKLPNYIAPLFPAMAILVGWWWEERDASDLSMRLSSLLLALLSLLLATAFFSIPFFINRAQTMFPTTPYLTAMQQNFRSGSWLLAFEVIVGIMGAVLFLRYSKKVISFCMIVATMGVLIITLFVTVLPVVSSLVQGPLHDYAQIVGARLASHENLIVYGLNKPSVVFYSRSPARVFIRHNPENFSYLKGLLDAKERCYIITKESLVAELKGEPNFFILGQRGGYVLASNKEI